MPQVVKDDEPVAVVSIKGPNEWFLMTARDWTITAFDSEVEATRYFERGYRDSMTRGSEGSASACIHSISFDPRIHRASLNELKMLLVVPAKPFSVNNISGFMHGLLLGPKGQAWHEAGIRPQLV